MNNEQGFRYIVFNQRNENLKPVRNGLVYRTKLKRTIFSAPPLIKNN